jgi:MFS family permease
MLQPAPESLVARNERTDRLYTGEFLVIWIGNVCFVLANAMIAQYGRWIEFLGGDVRQIGKIMGVGAVLSLLLRPWMGQWINRFGPRRVWAAGLAIYGVGVVGNFSISDVSILIYVLRGFLAVGAAFVFASSLAYISQSAPPHRRTEAIGILGAAGFMGMLIGPILADVILAGEQRTEMQFFRLFTIALAVLFAPLMSLLVIPALKRDTDKPATGVRLSDFVRMATKYWPGAVIWVVLAFGLCMTVPFVFLPSYIDEIAPNTTFYAVGLYFAGYAGWGLLLRVSTSHLHDKMGRGKVLLLGTAFMGAQMFTFLAVSPQNLWTLLIPALLGGTGHALMFHTMMSLTLESFPEELRGTGSALSLMTLDAGMLCGAPAIGWIASQWGFIPAFGLIGACCVLSAFVYGASILRGQAQPAVT